MKYYLITIFILLKWSGIQAQNCNAFKYYGDTLQYEACVIAEEAENHYQFSGVYHEIYDRAIEKCAYFPTAYHAKSVAYLKSGDFVSWKALMDKAVELKPAEYLGYRGWCRYQFCRDYQGAIEDIERLDALIDTDLGYSSNGDYHLNIAKGLCYKAIGENSKAIHIMEQQIGATDYSVGIYDYVHLGVLYLETDNLDKAFENLKLQEVENNVAECQYYLAEIYKAKGKVDQAKMCLVQAKQLYTKGLRLFDPYTQVTDNVYLKQIEDALTTLSK
ncbi:MAG: tetratricopeptide repeat protein [Chitinophagales bacterium]